MRLQYASKAAVIVSVTAVMAVMVMEANDKSILLLLAYSAVGTTALRVWTAAFGESNRIVVMTLLIVIVIVLGKYVHAITYIIEGMERTGKKFAAAYEVVKQDAALLAKATEQDARDLNDGVGRSRRIHNTYGPRPVDGKNTSQSDALSSSYARLYAARKMWKRSTSRSYNALSRSCARPSWQRSRMRWSTVKRILIGWHKGVNSLGWQC
mmetsp:Transcript_27400/g.74297  ORF Transcript_27400/g.74297 Transcript_27400/m.74297 type:complete len:210 (-) Transcript_27400:3195-3824(-)